MNNEKEKQSTQDHEDNRSQPRRCHRCRRHHGRRCPLGEDRLDDEHSARRRRPLYHEFPTGLSLGQGVGGEHQKRGGAGPLYLRRHVLRLSDRREPAEVQLQRLYNAHARRQISGGTQLRLRRFGFALPLHPPARQLCVGFDGFNGHALRRCGQRWRSRMCGEGLRCWQRPTSAWTA